MKTMMKSIVLMMMIAMFAWGCGDDGGPGTNLVNNAENNKDDKCDAQLMCEAEGYDFAIAECTAANSQAPSVCETFELCGEKVACHSKEGKNNNNGCEDKIECPAGTYQIDNCNDPAIADNCSVMSICEERIF